MTTQVQIIGGQHLAWPAGWSISECGGMAFLVTPDGGIAPLNLEFAKAAVEAGMAQKETT